VILDWFRGIASLKNFNPDKYNGDWKHIISWWNDHDQGIRPWDNITFGVSTISRTTSYTLLASDQLVFMDTTSGVLTVTLPTASVLKGKEYTVINTGTHLLTISPNGSDTINGGSFLYLPNQYFHAQLLSDGSNWFAI